MLLEHLLTELSYGISGTVSTGEEAIRLAASERPDLIIMDVGLKGKMNGIEAARLICQQKQVPVLFLTAYTVEEISENQSLPEQYGFLSKPVMMEDLDKKLIELFGRIE